MSNDAQRQRFEKAMGLVAPTRAEGSYCDLKIRAAFVGFCAAEAQYEGLVKAAKEVCDTNNPVNVFYASLRHLHDELEKLEGKK